MSATKQAPVESSAPTGSKGVVTRPRYESIDILRFWCQTQMILVHFVDDWSGHKWGDQYFRYQLFGATLFLLLNGISFHISSGYTLLKYGNEHGLSRVRSLAIRRGIFLILCHFFQAAVVKLDLIAMFDSDILWTHAMAQFTMAVVCAWETKHVFGLSFLIFFLTPVLQHYFDPYDIWYWDPSGGFHGALDYEIEWKDMNSTIVLRNTTCNGLFPYFPFVGFSITGFGVGHLLFPVTVQRNKTIRTPVQDEAMLQTISRIGTILLGLAVTLLLIGGIHPKCRSATYGFPFLNLDGYIMGPNVTFEYVVGALGKDLLWITFAVRTFDGTLRPTSEPSRTPTKREIRTHWWRRLVSVASKRSLTIYMFHHWVTNGVMRARAFINGHPPMHYEAIMFENPLISIACGLAFMVPARYLLEWMDRKKIPMVEEALVLFCKVTETMEFSAKGAVPISLTAACPLSAVVSSGANDKS